MSDDEKSKRFNDSFKVLTDLNDKVLLKNIISITTPEGSKVSDPAQIKEFVENVNATVINELQDRLAEVRRIGTVKPLRIKATEEQIKKGAPATFDVPVTFDTANFFV